MTTVLAVYAALVSTSAIVWQIVSWRLARRTVLRVHLSRHRVERDDVLVHDTLIASVVNLSEHPVRITKARLTGKMQVDRPLGVDWLFAISPDPDGFIPEVVDLGDDLARVIEARDSAEALVPVEALEQAGLQAWLPLQVYVLTATDEWFSSEPVDFRSFERETAPPAAVDSNEAGAQRRARVTSRPTRPRRRPNRRPPPKA